MRKYLCLLLIIVLFQPVYSQVDSTDSNQANQVTVYLVRHAWHAGIVFPNAVADSLLISDDFPEADYFEIGWGDADYYRQSNPGVWVTFKAALLPSMSTLHVAGLDRSVTEYFPGRDVISLSINPENILPMIAFINKSFAKDKNGVPVILETGLYGTSTFYKGSQYYFACKNCNTWAARALNKAGVEISPLTTLTVKQLFNKLREIGTVIQEAGS